VKAFYSVPDTASVRDVPQPVQHLAIGAMAQRLGGEIVFYTMEDVYTVHTHEVVRGKLAEQPAIDGVVFYRLAQFFHDGIAAVATMHEFLERGYLLAFARERITIAGALELERLFPLLATCGRLDVRDRDRGFVRAGLPVIEAFLANLPA
jgi:hypothetical protein